VVPVSALPMTAQDVRALRIRINDLREQLQDAASRRSNIAGQLRSADPSARPGIEARMGELDSRILRIEKDISEVTRQLTGAPTSALTQGRWPGQFPENVARDLVPVVGILSIFVLAPFAIAMSRLIWKRASVTMPRVAATDQATMRAIEQLQQSVDTIAIEVERISEGQRFVTKVLSDRPALGAGEAQPVRAQQQSAVPSERG
jgi:cell division septum initiation protein DivIVA